MVSAFTASLWLATLQDVFFRRVANHLWLGAVFLTLVMLIVESVAGLRLLALLLVGVIGFVFWRAGIWGGADGRWLPLCLAWLPLKEWPAWLLVFGFLLLLYSALAATYRYLKPTKINQVATTGLAVLLPMTITQCLWLMVVD